jgi:hypothetical protein
VHGEREAGAADGPDRSVEPFVHATTNGVLEDEHDGHDGPHDVPAADAIVEGPGVVEEGDQGEGEGDLHAVHRFPGVVRSADHLLGEAREL